MAGHLFQDQGHILIVEDSATQAARFCYLLERNGYRVTSTVNGTEALTAARANPPDLIISDIVMPEMDGYTLCKSVKGDAVLLNVPVILMTSLSTPEDIVNGLECGADNFIRKPFKDEYLLARVAYILSNRRARLDARTGVEMELVLRGKRYRITSERQQILDLLVSTYEEAVILNRELQDKQQQLAALAAELEEKVRARTADLATEILERKQAEAKYRGLLEAAPDSVVEIDARGSIVFVNAQTEAQFGYERADLLGKPLEVLFPDDLRQTVQAHCDRYRSGSLPSKSKPPIPLRGRRKDKSEFPVEVALNPLTDSSGPKLISIIRDVSEREKLERQLRQSQKLEALGSLSGGIAHDFNNLLNIILGYNQLIREIGATAPRKYFDAVETATRSGAQLTRQLLAFSRQQRIEPILLNLNQVVIDVSSMLGRLIGDNIHLGSALEPQLAQVKADPCQMEQILMNLAVNARDAMPDGGRLTINTTNADLDPSYLRDHGVDTAPGRYVVLTITDTGIGMDADTQARIFEPFFTTKELGKGTGLGLSTVYGIVRQNGGYIWVYSEIGKGTTFKIYLPSCTEGPQRVPIVQPRVVPRGNETVLLVEDSEPLRDLACEYLKSAGYSVLEAASSEQAIQLANHSLQPIQVLVTDISMPGMSGVKLARHLRGRIRDLRIVCISGYAPVAGDSLARGPGFAFLEKPFSREDLIQRVHDVLGEKTTDAKAETAH